MCDHVLNRFASVHGVYSSNNGLQDGPNLLVFLSPMKRPIFLETHQHMIHYQVSLDYYSLVHHHLNDFQIN